jgi:hypothetical protein
MVSFEVLVLTWRWRNATASVIDIPASVYVHGMQFLYVGAIYRKSQRSVTNYLRIFHLEDACKGGALCSIIFVEKCLFLLCDLLSVFILCWVERLSFLDFPCWKCSSWVRFKNCEWLYSTSVDFNYTVVQNAQEWIISVLCAHKLVFLKQCHSRICVYVDV